jgi:Uma2 family endonuclease
LHWLRSELHEYRDRHPQANDVLLIVEIADESLRYDRGSKRRAYALAGIPEFWIVNLRESALEVFRKPEGDRYTEELRLAKTDRIAPLHAPSGEVSIADFLP